LAGHLGIPSIDELLSRLSSRDFAYRRIMYRHGLFGTRREERMFGTVAAFVGNGARLMARAQGKVLLGDEWHWTEVFQRRPRKTREERNTELGFKLRMFVKGMPSSVEEKPPRHDDGRRQGP
jgi:hypothetical protein